MIKSFVILVIKCVCVVVWFFEKFRGKYCFFFCLVIICYIYINYWNLFIFKRKLVLWILLLIVNFSLLLVLFLVMCWYCIWEVVIFGILKVLRYCIFSLFLRSMLYCGIVVIVKVIFLLFVFLLNIFNCLFLIFVWFSFVIFKGWIIVWGVWLLIGFRIIWNNWFLIVLFVRLDMENLNWVYLVLVLSFMFGDLKFIFLCCIWSWVKCDIFIFIFEWRIFFVILVMLLFLFIKCGFFVIKYISFLFEEFLFV